MKFGSGRYTYEYDKSWGYEAVKRFKITVVAGVTVDEENNVYVLTRTNPPVIILNKKGYVRETFGGDLFGRAHGMYCDHDGSLFGVDDGRHAVYKFGPAPDRAVIMTLGTPDRSTNTGYSKEKTVVLRPAGPFNRPTRMITDDLGNIYVTDGYGNARVHKFSADGRLLLSWGEPGKRAGQFNLPHGISISLDNKTLYVADRQNNRVQLFTTGGKFIDAWNNFQRPSDIWVDEEGVVYVSENRRSSNFGSHPSRITILAPDGEILVRLGEEAPVYSEEKGFYSAHGLAVDREGSIYVGCVGQRWPEGFCGLAKYRRV